MRTTAWETDRTGVLMLFVVVITAACSTAAIVATYSRLSHTWDEGTHVVAGLELLQDGRYTFQTENPPLSRVVLATIPYLAGARLPPPDDRGRGGPGAAGVFYRTPRYIRNVTEARVANLLFFWACIALTWLLAGARADPWVSFLASAAVATLPPIVAHAGFATTDVAFVASFLLALVALRRLLSRPGPTSAVLAGVGAGVAIATKFSALVLLPPVVITVCACHNWDGKRQWAAALANKRFYLLLATTGLVASTVIWASYAFHVGRLSELPPLPTRLRGVDAAAELVPGWTARIRDWRVPGHEFLHGLLLLRAHTVAGHQATLLGEYSDRGFWLFYPVVLATKTPVPFLVFAGLGLVGLSRSRADRWRWFTGLALGALGVLLVAMTSPINLGVRHVLVIYPLIALAGAFGIVRSAESTRHVRLILSAATATLALQLGLLISTVPDQITYFNVFAGSDPAYVSSDSDFDWGQHALALERYFATHHVPELYVSLSGTTRICSLQLPPLKALPTHPVSGWIAVSERNYRVNRGPIQKDPCVPAAGPAQGNAILAPPGWLDWLKRYEPVDVIGKTVRLYHIP